MSVPDYDEQMANRTVCLVCIGTTGNGGFVHSESLLDIVKEDQLEVWFAFSDKRLIKVNRKDFETFVKFCVAVRDVYVELTSVDPINLLIAAVDPNKLFKTLLYWASLEAGGTLGDTPVSDVVPLLYGDHTSRTLTLHERAYAFSLCARLGLKQQEPLTGHENIDSILRLIMKAINVDGGA